MAETPSGPLPGDAVVDCYPFTIMTALQLHWLLGACPAQAQLQAGVTCSDAGWNLP